MNTKVSKPQGRYQLLAHGIYDANDVYSSSSAYLKGEINYASDGCLSLLIVFAETQQTPREVLAYVGTYQVVSEDLVEHHISLSSAPTLTNTVEARSFKLAGGELRLGKNLADGKRFEAVWQKITADP